MLTFLERLRGRMGDFWWHSLLLFLSCRAADVANAFVGLWLVPKYVGTRELGAVLPLSQFASLAATPVFVFASAFRNEVSRLSAEREFGKLKSLMRGVFSATAVFLAIAVAASRFAMPAFLERLRIAEGSLAFVVVAAGFASAAAPVFTNALQALGKFGTLSLINVFGAPVRLLAMLAAMPFRAVTGYFAGQASVPAFAMAASVFGLRRELSAKAEPYWSRETLRRFASLAGALAAIGIVGGFYCLVEPTIIRQRLPEADSAAYYVATRISEVATYLFTAVNLAIFPAAAKLADRPAERFALVKRTLVWNLAFCALAGAASAAFGKTLLGLLPDGAAYAEYWWAVPCLVATTAVSSVSGLYTTAEIAAGRFGYLKWMLPLDAAYPALLLLVTGHGYFAGVVPASWTSFLDAHNIRSLSTMLAWIASVNVLRSVLCLLAMRKGAKEAAGA